MGILFLVMVVFTIFCIVVGQMFDEKDNAVGTFSNTAANNSQNPSPCDGMLFETIVKEFVRKYNLCATPENSIEELVISTEIFFLFVNLLHCYSGFSDTLLVKETIGGYVSEIIHYIKNNKNFIDIEIANQDLINLNNYDYETLKVLYLKKRHIPYFLINRALSIGEIDVSQYKLELLECLNTFIYEDLISKYGNGDNYKNIFLLPSKESNDILLILTELVQIAVFFAQKIKNDPRYLYHKKRLGL